MTSQHQKKLSSILNSSIEIQIRLALSDRKEIYFIPRCKYHYVTSPDLMEPKSQLFNPLFTWEEINELLTTHDGRRTKGKNDFIDDQ